MQLRYSEVEYCDWTDVDLANGTIHIRGTKTEKADREVPISAPLRRVLLQVPESDRHGKIVEHWGNIRRDLGDTCCE